jgi:D-tyrosyl-tRNA(Tyr) deacylase
MRACIQRVSEASVTVAGEVTGRIGRGLVVLLGVGTQDGAAEVEWLAEKLVNLRIFEDDEGKMNRSLVDVGGAMLVVSQFTLFGDARKGRRPSFTEAAPPELASRLYEEFVARVRGLGVEVQTGVFRAHMDVALVNDGPVTLWIDTADV